MSEDQKSHLWGKCLSYVKSRIEETAFQTWFEVVKINSFDDESITLIVPNRFHYEWLETKYRNLINDAIKAAFGRSLIVNYSVILTEKTPENIPKFKESSKKIIPPGYHRPSNLNDRYVFENFIEGKGNQFARAAAISVTDKPGQTFFNPLLVYSSPGLGKTHLIQAAGNRMIRKNRALKILYITGEKFMLDFIGSIQNNKSADFIKFYRNVDMLLLDDVQFFVGKEQTQEQFFHLFNDLYQREKQIILTTDRHPRKLVGLQERLISRFQSGLIADIQAPDLETRIAIIMNEAKHTGIDLEYAIVEFIANSITEDIRVMKSLLVRLQALSTLKNIDIDLALCREVIRDNLGDSRLQSITLLQILNYVSKAYEINSRKIVGKNRSQEIAEARQIIMFLTRKLTNLSLKHIGKELGGRDHSTVIHSCNLVASKIKNDPAFKKRIEKHVLDLNRFGNVGE
tara:strand:- start:66 stop:1436 length:1371 start_codon:yes stop_codon:yes gene_type:complete